MFLVNHTLARYLLEVDSSKLTSSTKATYARHAKTFVRWLRRDFHPGSSKKA